MCVGLFVLHLCTQESLKDMKTLVEELEASKRQLLTRSGVSRSNHVSSISPSSSKENTRLHSFKDDPLSASMSLVPLSSKKIQRDEFVRITEQIERLRRDNAALARLLHERDLFNSGMQHLLLEFQKQSGPPDGGTDDDESESEHHGASPLCTLIGFTPLTPDEVSAFAEQALRQCQNARLDHASEAHCSSSRGKVFGWSDFSTRRGSSISFSVKKSLANVLPTAMLNAMWHSVTDSSRIMRLLPAGLQCDIRVLQRISESILVIDRRTYTADSPVALRTVYMLFRVHDFDGGDVLVMKTIDSPLVKNLLLKDEVWCDIFYWMRFAPGMKVPNTDQVVETMAEFGGALSYVREEFARAWLAELVFLAVRWETIAVSPVLLKA